MSHKWPAEQSTISSTSQTHRIESPTIQPLPDLSAALRLQTRLELTPLRRTTALSGICCASATRRCASRRVIRPSNSPWSPENRSPQLQQLNRRRIHTNVVRRPDTSKSRTSRSRTSCTLWHLNPQYGHRTRLAVDSTRTLNTAKVSMNASTTRIWRRCNRTRITSVAIEALLDR